MRKLFAKRLIPSKKKTEMLDTNMGTIKTFNEWVRLRESAVPPATPPVPDFKAAKAMAMVAANKMQTKGSIDADGAAAVANDPNNIPDAVDQAQKDNPNTPPPDVTTLVAAQKSKNKPGMVQQPSMMKKRMGKR